MISTSTYDAVPMGAAGPDFALVGDYTVRKVLRKHSSDIALNVRCTHCRWVSVVNPAEMVLLSYMTQYL